jgi:hypothetical protein
MYESAFLLLQRLLFAAKRRVESIVEAGSASLRGDGAKDGAMARRKSSISMRPP